MSNVILEVKNLAKKFNGFEAIKDISFSVEEGQIMGFLGPNG
ncbi:MAG: ABC transporter, ATP-binding protein, partial [Candidatus Daviesbacteria bacterium GW2011_GWF2_38_7]